MKYITIKNWDKFQHYKDRRPTWIKLLIDIIDEFDEDGFAKEFYKLPDTAKLTFVMLLCLRANYNKHIPYPDNKWLRKRLGISTVNLQPLITAGFIVIDTGLVQDDTVSVQDDTEQLQTCTNSLPPERERETETETEREERSRFTPPTIQDIRNLIQERNYSVNATRFFNFYESKGWMVGRNKMKDWRSALAGWESRDKKPPQPTTAHKLAEYEKQTQEMLNG